MTDQTNMTFLVADDMNNMLVIIKSILHKMGYKQVITVPDGKNAIRVLENQQIDFIISDWNMPVVSGLELLKWVRDNDKMKNLPFLMVTAEVTQESVVSAIQSGVDSYIVKPFAPAILMEKVTKMLNSQN